MNDRTSDKPLQRIARQFREARGVDADAEWAEEVFLALAWQGVTVTATQEILGSSLDLVRSSGEAPRDLFGDSRSFAREQLAERQEAGLPTLSADPSVAWGDAAVVAAAASAILTAMMMIVFGLRRTGQIELTAGIVALPVLLPLAALGSVAVFETVLARHRLLVAVACAAGVAVTCTATQIWLFAAATDWSLGTVPTWSLLGGVLGFAGLAALLARVLPETPNRSVSRTITDDQWRREAAGILRLRANLPEARVKRVIDDAVHHAKESGQPLQAEFGLPETFAARFPRDQTTAKRRKLTLYLCLLPAPILLAFGDAVAQRSWSEVSWTGLATLALWGWLVYDAAKAYRQAQRKASVRA